MLGNSFSVPLRLRMAVLLLIQRRFHQTDISLMDMMILPIPISYDSNTSEHKDASVELDKVNNYRSLRAVQ